ncbi:MAG: putative bicarbonate transporter, IctB family [Synechococcus sp. BS307-5m-G38]|nr:putative bicarbonate transporter, IctB family [Synechococcus sp. BS307-5m-G38]
MADAAQPMAPALLQRWQGCLAASTNGLKRLELLSGSVLMLLLASLPFVSRSGLAVEIAAAGALWVLWSLVTPAARIGALSGWVLLFLAIALISTGFSPVPAAAAKGLLKLISYLGVYALMRKLLDQRSLWWDRLLAALLSGGLLSSVLALRQLYASTEELAGWADPNSVSAGTIRIYGPLGNPNLLAGYLIPLLALAVVACLRWQRLSFRLFAGLTAAMAGAATLFTYSRGGWLGLLAAAGVLGILLLLRSTAHWPPLWRRLLPLAALLIGALVLVVAVTQLEPIRTRVMSLLAGRGDSSNNFRINVWLAAIDMVQDRPWLGIGPGNAAFNSIYPLYQQPKFNALSAYSVPLEILVETGIPGLLACLGLLASSVQAGLRIHGRHGLIAIGSLSAIAGLLTQGITDTIFFRPEVQLIGWFCLATLAASWLRD